MLAAGSIPLVLALAGCATPQLPGADGHPPAQVSARKQIEPAPLSTWTDCPCAPALPPMVRAASPKDGTPDELIALLISGNQAYALGDLALAERAFLRAASAYPDSVAARNNLALALAGQGRLGEALAIARRAVMLGGPLQDIALGTLEAIEQAIEELSADPYGDTWPMQGSR